MDALISFVMLVNQIRDEKHFIPLSRVGRNSATKVSSAVDPAGCPIRVYDHDRLFRMCFLEFQLLRSRFETSLLNLDILTGTWLKWDFWRNWHQFSPAGCFLDPWDLSQQTKKKSIFFETNKLTRLKWSLLLSTNN